MALIKTDAATRQQIIAIATRIIGYPPTDAMVDRIIDDINSRRINESATERVILSIKASRSLTEGQIKTARDSGIDRIVDEIDKKTKPK